MAKESGTFVCVCWYRRGTASAAEVDIHASVGSVCVDDIEETETSLHCAAAVNI